MTLPSTAILLSANYADTIVTGDYNLHNILFFNKYLAIKVNRASIIDCCLGERLLQILTLASFSNQRHLLY